MNRTALSSLCVIGTLAVALAVHAGCDGSTSSQPAEQLTAVDSVTLEVEAAGAVLRGPDLGPLAGFELSIPAGAVPESATVTLTLQAVVDATELPPAAYRVGPMVEITASAPLLAAASLTAPTFREDVYAYGQESLQVKVWRRALGGEWEKLEGLSFADDSVTVPLELSDDAVTVAAGVKLGDARCDDCVVIELGADCGDGACAVWATSPIDGLIADAIAVDHDAAFVVGVNSNSHGFADRVALGDGAVARIAAAYVDDPWAILRARRTAADGGGGVIATGITGAVHFDATGLWSMPAHMHAYSAGLTEMVDGRVALLTYDGAVTVHTYSGLGWVLAAAEFDLTPGPASVFHMSPDGKARTGALWAVSDGFGDHLIHVDLGGGAAALRPITALPCAAQDVVSLASEEAGPVVVCGAKRRAYTLVDSAFVATPELDGLSALTPVGSAWVGVSPADGTVRRVHANGQSVRYALMAEGHALTPTALAAGPAGEIIVLASGRLIRLDLPGAP